MANSIGTLLVELGVNIAAFSEGMDKATYKAKQSAKEIGHAFEGLGKDLGGLLSRFGEIGNVIGEALGGAGETLAKLSGTFGSLSGGAAEAAIAVGGIAAAGVGVAAALGAMAIKGAELVHELDMVSQKTGINTDQLLVYKAAGQTVGVSLDAMVMAFRRFDQALIGTGRGSSQAQIVLKSLGVTAKDNQTALEQVAEAFKKMQDGPAKAADAVALFGRTGLNMIPFLNKGKEGIAEFNKLVDEYGPKVGVDAKKANEDYLVSQVKLSLAWDKMVVSVEKSVLPVITKLIGGFADLIKGTRDAASAFDDYVGKMAKNAAYLAASLFSDDYATKLAAQMAKQDENAKKAESDAKAKEAADKAASVLAGERYSHELEIFEAIKSGGEAAERLRSTQEKINVLLEQAKESAGSGEAVGYVKRAEALQRMIPALEQASKLEKAQREFQLNPKDTVLEPSKIAEMVSKLDDQVKEQQKLNDAINSGAGSKSVLTAMSRAAVEMDNLEAEARKKVTIAQEEYNRVAKSAPGTQAEHDALEKLIAAVKEEADTKAARDGYIQETGIKAREAEKQKIKDEIDALNAEIAAWNKLSDAIGKNASQKASAQGEAARIKTKQATGSDELADVAAAKASASANKDYTDSIRKMALEEYNLNYQYADRMEKLSAAKDLQEEYGRSTLLVDAAIYDEQEKINKQWEDAIKKVGGFKDNMKVLLMEINQQGQNLWASFAADGKAALDSLNSEIAKFAVTGKLNLKQVAESLGESLIKSSLQKIESSIAGAILGKGAGVKADGSQSAPFYVIPTDENGTVGGGLLGKIAGGGGSSDEGSGGDETDSSSPLGGILSKITGALGTAMSSIMGVLSKVISGIGSIFSSIFKGFLAGGGDVTPGKAYVVGEKHPEFFIPNVSGTVVPKMTMGDGPKITNVAVHFHGVADADTFKRSQSQILSTITNSVGHAMGRR